MKQTVIDLLQKFKKIEESPQFFDPHNYINLTSNAISDVKDLVDVINGHRFGMKVAFELVKQETFHEKVINTIDDLKYVKKHTPSNDLPYRCLVHFIDKNRLKQNEKENSSSDQEKLKMRVD